MPEVDCLKCFYQNDDNNPYYSKKFRSDDIGTNVIINILLR